MLRLLNVSSHSKSYAVFCGRASDPKEENYLMQMRIVSCFAPRFIFHALTSSEADAFPDQNLTIDELVWFFIEHQQQEWGGRGSELSGVMGGDGDWAIEKLSFGFMVENDHHKVYRIWSRAWLVTK